MLSPSAVLVGKSCVTLENKFLKTYIFHDVWVHQTSSGQQRRSNSCEKCSGIGHKNQALGNVRNRSCQDSEFKTKTQRPLSVYLHLLFEVLFLLRSWITEPQKHPLTLTVVEQLLCAVMSAHVNSATQKKRFMPSATDGSTDAFPSTSLSVLFFFHQQGFSALNTQL